MPFRVALFSCLVLTAATAFGSPMVSDVQALPSNQDATAAAGVFAGNDNNLLSQLNAGLFPAFPADWVLVGKSDDASNGPFTSNPAVASGVLTLDSAIDGPVVLSLKASNAYVAYLFDDSFTGITGFVFDTSAIPFAQNPHALSHASLFRFDGDLGPGGPGPGGPGPGGPGNQVPEPMSLAVWGVVLSSTWLARRRRSPALSRGNRPS